MLAEGPPAEVLTPALVGELFDIDPALAAPILAAAPASPISRPTSLSHDDPLRRGVP